MPVLCFSPLAGTCWLVATLSVTYPNARRQIFGIVIALGIPINPGRLHAPHERQDTHHLQSAPAIERVRGLEAMVRCDLGAIVVLGNPAGVNATAWV